MLHALLIDDEASARADLRGKLAAHRDVAIVGEAATVLTARALLASADYDVVFLDVQLIGGESFQLVPLVRPGASLVFATAHDRYAVRAFESNAVDYLLKPIDSARLTEALRRAATAHANRGAHARLATAERPGRPPVPVHPSAVDRPSFALENSREVALTDNERVFLRQCLEAWEDALPVTHLLRAPRAETTRFPRAVRYERDTEPTQLWIASARVSRVRRWWRALRARFTR